MRATCRKARQRRPPGNQEHGWPGWCLPPWRWWPSRSAWCCSCSAPRQRRPSIELDSAAGDANRRPARPARHLTGRPAPRFSCAGPERRNVVWVRPLDGLTAQPTRRHGGRCASVLVPGQRFIAFASAGKLRKIDASGGQALALCDSGNAAAGTWNGDVILFSPNNRREPISRVGAGGGTPTPVTKLDEAAGETAHRYPGFPADGRHFLYVAYAGTVPRAVYVGLLDGSDRTQVMEGGLNVAYAQGFLLFIRDER